MDWYYKMNKPQWLPDTQGFLAIAIIALIGIIIIVLMVHPITLDDKISGMLTMLIGVLTACLKDVYSYFFGSSKGSSLKDETIKAAMEAPNNVKQDAGWIATVK